MEKTILTITTGVYCNDDYADGPTVAVIELTQKELDKYKHLSKVVKREGVWDISELSGCGWYEGIPLREFKDIGRFMFEGTIDSDYTSDTEFEDDPLSSETINMEMVHIRENTFFFVGYGKHSGTKYESVAVSYKDIDAILAKEPAPKKEYFDKEAGDNRVLSDSLKDIPTSINSDDHVIAHYSRELLKEINK